MKNTWGTLLLDTGCPLLHIPVPKRRVCTLLRHPLVGIGFTISSHNMEIKGV